MSRFESKVDRTGECHLWKASLNEDGYGNFRFNGQMRLAHRVAFQLYTGKNPGKKKVCHSCDNPACVNPEHLWLGTQKQNMSDASAKGRIAQSKLTHCSQGHEFDRRYWNSAKGSFQRMCSICMKERDAIKWRKKKALIEFRTRME